MKQSRKDTEDKMERFCKGCDKHHKCGVVCSSKKCFDDKCSCSAIQIAAGLYHCDHCRVLFSVDRKSFEDYFEDIEKWYTDFCAKQEVLLHKLEQQALDQSLTDPSERVLYKTISSFLSAKTNFNKNVPATLQLHTIRDRQNAYALKKKYEELKNLAEGLSSKVTTKSNVKKEA